MDDISRYDDVARMFREHDDIGSDSSLWLRPLRQLLKQGKPIGQVVALMVSPMKHLKLHFGMLTQTEKNRLIFWPILPPDAKVMCAGENVDVFDHITLGVSFLWLASKPAWRFITSSSRFIRIPHFCFLTLEFPSAPLIPNPTPSSLFPHP